MNRLVPVARVLGALSLLGVGVVHIEQYYVDSYSLLPTIGTLFVLNFVSAAVVALGLLAPLRRVAGRWADAAHALLALGGIAIALGSLVALAISETSTLFGFSEIGYRLPIVLSIGFEGATVILLGLFVGANGLGFERRVRASAWR